MLLGPAHLCAAALLVLGVGCTGGDAEPTPSGTPEGSTTTIIAQLDLPETSNEPEGAASVFDPATVSVCAVIDPAAVGALLGAETAESVETAVTSASVDPFGEIRTCTWSSGSSTRGLSLGVTSPASSLDDFLALSLVTDAALGFDRRPVEVGDEALAQVVDSTTQDVGRLCIATSAKSALWLACLSETDRSFGLDDPDVESLADALNAGFLALVDAESESPSG